MSDKQYDNTNRGAIFRNDRKTQDNHPSHKGNAHVQFEHECECPNCKQKFTVKELVKYWISAWVKDSPKGGRFFSLSFQKDGTGGGGGGAAQRPARSSSAPAPTQATRGSSTQQPPRSSPPTENLEEDVPF